MPTSPRAEYVEDVTGEPAEAAAFSQVVPVVVTAPVRVEDYNPRTITAETFNVGDGSTLNPSRIAPESLTRASLTVSCRDAPNSVGCLIGGPGLSQSTGFYLPHGQTITLHTTGEVWAAPYGLTDTVVVSVLAEHR